MTRATLKGIIFDFNGVLLWDSVLHIDAWQVMAVELRGSTLSEEEFSLEVYGRPNSHILSYLTGRHVQGQELLDLTQVKESMYRNLCLSNPATFVLSPGTEALLDFLATGAIPRTIATSSEKTNLDFFRHHLGLDKWFDAGRIVYDDGSFPGKPAPDIYAKAADELHLLPQECIVIEDAISGIMSAHAANIGYIVGLGPRSTHARLQSCEGVSTTIESLEHFPREVLPNASKPFPPAKTG